MPEFSPGSLLNTEESKFDAVFSINVKGAFFCTQYALKAMLDSGSGSIVNIGSTHGFGGNVDLAAYACSKGALHTLTQHIVINYARKGIRANYLTVGWVITPGEIAVKAVEGKDLDWLNAQKAQIPSGRMQTEEDIAYGVVYLLSDESSQVFGTDLHITGGYLPR
jgi:NAD(P)-dependent dehydrogenase (short-subunit alcohol dehydrogenase family)